MEDTMAQLIIAGILVLLLFSVCLAIFTFRIRRQVDRINIRLEKIMKALKIKDDGIKVSKAKPGGARKGLQLDDDDIEKLKKIGVGMD